ncbi:hypothetical protein [Halalkalibacter urbisdiaboli]|uniref:hypothetical protein n=1 Tax=Halalkalibacter urbisdiaboli TaxID=1960589 RepID=UPI000B43707F|nr:hypothetical protein [Halalkalibacter urbisdiaboli]
MSKLQILQLAAVIALGIYVVIMYQRGDGVNWLFYIIAAINLILWFLRQIERRKTNSNSIEN